MFTSLPTFFRSHSLMLVHYVLFSLIIRNHRNWNKVEVSVGRSLRFSSCFIHSLGSFILHSVHYVSLHNNKLCERSEPQEIIGRAGT